LTLNKSDSTEHVILAKEATAII